MALRFATNSIARFSSIVSMDAGNISSGAALSKVDDTNVTATLSGTPTTALLKATTITLGWTGTLATSRGGFGLSMAAANGVTVWTAGTPNQAGTTGTGNVVRDTSPTLVTPLLGTPTSGVLSNCTGYPLANLTGAGTGVLAALAINTGSAGAPVLFNGAGGTPSSITLTSATGLPVSTGISGLGTGVATALAVNVGSAGAFVTFNGAGGTPSSITLTNGTGLPISTGVSGLGTGIATALGTAINTAGSVAPVTSPALGGTPTAPTAAVDTNTTQIATTAMVLAQAASATPLASTTAGAVGTSTRYARGDHVHPASSTNTPILFSSGNNSAIAQNTTTFFTYGSSVSTENVCAVPMSAPGTLKNLYASTNSAPAAGQTFTLTVRKNGSDTTLTCTITSAGTTANDTTHTVAYVAGDLISIKVVTSATSGTMTGANVGLTLVTSSP